MGLKNSKLMKLFTLLLIINFLTIQLTQSLTNVGTLNSIQASQPNIDGIINDSEWSEAQELEIQLYLESFPSTLLLNITMMSIYDETAGTISFALTIPDGTEDQSDGVYLVFKTNPEEELIITQPSFNFGEGHDLKAYTPYYDMLMDACSTSGIPLDDATAGGTNDGSGKSQHDSGQYTIELVFPLASGDVLGKDFNLTEGSEIEFTVLYFKEGSVYSQMHDLTFDCLNLSLLPSTKLFGIEKFVLITGLISSMLMVIVITRKRK